MALKFITCFAVCFAVANAGILCAAAPLGAAPLAAAPLAAAPLAAAPLAAAPVAAVAQVEEYDPYPQYTFGYNVQDSLSGDSKNQIENRDGNLVQGQYSLNDADGYRRIVDYTADPINGFNAVVRREPLVAAVAAAAPILKAAAPAPVVAAAPAPAPVVAAAPAPVVAAAPAPLAYAAAPAPLAYATAPAPFAAAVAPAAATALRTAFASPLLSYAY